MAEYVEKAAFREHLDSVPPFTKYGQRDPIYDFAKTVFLSELAAYPAADVAPIIHARWIEEDGVQTCSNCGEEHEWIDYRAPYCDACGAKMDGGNDG